ncbi:anti-sigma factor family protein [Alicyclobacillus acidocaldarius]|uniref:Putative transmembrane anti-sigma factor n=1 Tax=Alicyclobacillus acidocaldarius subsp. acidocaldarius (strain ATCC 27009 / DSM 446 / BCRC 14685 / JCM 5260 / KCTC 1825 / NBRC 15652 / NCIMB 11725 / NRRL B-14509 / 104-IA) TaxID=521098 RepID=C8WQZ1_ALIAD|nr:zf-HC2 domain-containing protein [Alicyclobacillus acidocaldarius]ACV59160.1 putative transmembrane anti-sigma factor [Alicyclobacillus acidocaldarius subsp. acidocaldarius DSM 446]
MGYGFRQEGENHLDNPSICSYCVDYALNELKDELVKKRFERHLATCPACRRDVAEFRELITMFQPKEAADDSPASTHPPVRSAQIIAFPARPKADFQPTSAKRYVRRRRLTAISLSFALLLMSFVSLAGDHGRYSKALGTAAWHRISHVSRAIVHRGEEITDKWHWRKGLL